MEKLRNSLKISRISEILLVCSLGSGPCLAFDLVIDPKDHALASRHPVTRYSGAGVTTIRALRELKIPFEGTEAGIASINGLGSDLEALSDTKMKAWGWCFAIDGKIADGMPDKTTVPEDARELKWFYAYALYDSGTWVGYCIQD